MCVLGETMKLQGDNNKGRRDPRIVSCAGREGTGILEYVSQDSRGKLVRE